jgi:hypothetical protein
MKIGSTHVLFQSFSSIGPFLDFVALFPVMVIFGGDALPEITALSFIISFLTLIPVLFFTGLSHTNEGYASYASLAFGRRMGMLTGFIYIAYSVLVLPNIIMFLSSFIFPLTTIPTGFKPYFYLGFSLLYLSILWLPLSRGLTWSIRPIVILGMIEITSIIALSIFMIYDSPRILTYPPFPTFFTGNFWDGVIIGILMFSGGGSGIFLQRDAERNIASIRKPLVTSYLVTGSTMTLASFGITYFLGNSMSQFGLDPDILFENLGAVGGFSVIIFFTILLFISGFNLTLSYGNALLQMSHDFLRRITKAVPSRFNLSFILLILASVVLVISYYTVGFYLSFLLIADLVSMLYVTVHIITGTSLIRTDPKGKHGIIGVLSVIILIFSITASLDGSYGDQDFLTALFLIVVSISIFLSVLMYNPDKAQSENMEPAQ